MFRALGFGFLFALVVVLWWDAAPEWVILAAWGAGIGLVLLGWYIRARYAAPAEPSPRGEGAHTPGGDPRPNEPTR